MIEKLKTINPYDETEIDMDVNSVAGLVYENTPLIQKINELVDAVNELQCKNVHIESDLQDLMYPKEIKGELGKNVQDEMPRCPFCGEDLFYVQEIDGGFDILACNCSAGFWLFGNDKMWYNLEKATTELDRTRKALDVAVDALKSAQQYICSDKKSYQIIQTAVEQITALEQKDK